MNDQERAAIQQALEALEKSGCVAFKGLACRCNSTCASYTAAVALRAALAQKPEPVQEPVAWMVEGSLYASKEVAQKMGGNAYTLQALYTAPPQQPEPAQEPVAWAISYDGKTPYSLWTEGDGALLDLEVKRQGGTTCKLPLYTSSLASKPLTDEEIAEAVREADLDWQAGWTLDEHEPNRFTTLARAIERKVRGETE